MKNLITSENSPYFPFFMWLSSRLIVCISMLGIAPLLPQPIKEIKADFSWNVFAGWDGIHYLGIVENGYQFINDGKGYNVAFFPLYPSLIYLGKILGFDPKIAGFLISNICFLIALIILFNWLKKEHDIKIARWTIAFLSFCPISLYSSVIYTEGLFFCLGKQFSIFKKKGGAIASPFFISQFP